MPEERDDLDLSLAIRNAALLSIPAWILIGATVRHIVLAFAL